MLTLLVSVLALLSLGASSPAPEPARDYAITPVPLTAVRFTDEFWRPRMEINRKVTIPHILEQNEVTGRIDNFLKAAHAKPGAYKGHRYDDTDVYKIVEAASYALAVAPEQVLDRKLDEIIAIIKAAQEPDGYVYAARTTDPEHPAPGVGPERWTWLHTSHELYNQGHLYEAAVAHYHATGKRSLLDIAIKSANLVCATFGPGKRQDVPGHEEIELALVKLWRVTGEQKYLDTAKFFLDGRGRPHNPPLHEFPVGDPFRMYNDLPYRQDAQPVTEQLQAVGHAVRAVYLYAGMTDAAIFFSDPAYAKAVDALWTDVASKRMYVTGGLGSIGGTEAFGDDYALPNRAYAETCASIGGMLWYHRMFLKEGDAKYYDTFERTLYNGYLSGVSLAGNTFFYQNPLVSNGRQAREAYFDVSCCPANLARLMAQLPGLVYATRGSEIFVNLFVGSDATIPAAGRTFHLTQQTQYPWNGRVTVTVTPDAPAVATLALRIPDWARGAAMPTTLYRFATATDRAGAGASAATTPPEDAPGPSVRVNGTPVPLTLDKGYLRLSRTWKAGDTVELELPMPVRRVLAHDGVTDDRGKAAIQRGPVVYCLEGVDNNGKVTDVQVPLERALGSRFRPDLLGGVVIVTGSARVTSDAGAASDKPFLAVPYFAWNNRGKGEMAVWLPY